MTASAWRTATGVVRAPWRIAAFLLAFAVAGIGTTILAQFATMTPVAEWARLSRVPLDQITTVGALLVATWLTGRIVHGESWQTWSVVGLSRDAWSLRQALVAFGAGIGVVLVPAALLLGTGFAHFAPSTASESPWFLAWSAVALLAPAAFGEELMFRGYVFSAAADAMGRRGAVAATSIAFGLAHLWNPGPTVASILGVAVAGVFLACVRLATGSLVAATAAHFAVNAAQAGILHTDVSGLALQQAGYRFVPTGPDWLTGGAWGPEAGIGVVAAMAVASFLYVRRRKETAAGALPTEPNP